MKKENYKLTKEDTMKALDCIRKADFHFFKIITEDIIIDSPMVMGGNKYKGLDRICDEFRELTYKQREMYNPEGYNFVFAFVSVGLTGEVPKQALSNKLKKYTLIASINSPEIFTNRKAILTVWNKSKPHNPNNEVVMFDLSNDHIRRYGRGRNEQKKFPRSIPPEADELYEEAAELITNPKAEPKLFKGMCIKTKIDIDNPIIEFNEYRDYDTEVYEEDLIKTVRNYLVWKIQNKLR